MHPFVQLIALSVKFDEKKNVRWMVALEVVQHAQIVCLWLWKAWCDGLDVSEIYEDGKILK